MDLDQSAFWTDSQTVLKYISSKTARYPVFVTNRLSIIRDGSEVIQWKYIPTKLNPADHASRGLDASELTKKKEWLEGPKFLKESEEMWPSDVKATIDEKYGDEPQREVNEIHIHTTRTNEENPVNALLSHYSDWNKLKRGVAWILKLKKRLQDKLKGKVGNSEERFNLTCTDIEDAELAIIQHVQLESYPDEMKYLAHGKGLPKNSTISSLDPMLSDGLLKVGGRLQHAKMPSSAKHQYILPRKHHVTTLVMQHVHRRVGHQGQNHMVAEIRQKYWIVGVGVLARNIAKRCIICKKAQGKAGYQKMAELPSSRVQGDERVFTKVGMDYFGPFEIKCGRSMRKRYDVIFTCMTSRAVHIEVASSLDTSSCIDAIRCFISRRGPVKEMFSDNGTNLVGDEKELKEALKGLNQEQMTNFHPTDDEDFSDAAPGTFDAKDVYGKRRWKQMQYLADLFWRRWVKEYLPSLQQRQKWLQPGRNLQVGDIVLIADETAPRCSWSMARVQEVMPDEKGFVRRAKVKTASSVLTRPVTKLCLLLEQEA
ncbi:uncharacterized protein [Diadema setosum]|uniref:uncharacterized protein n=1 Tax=Diadema setosum TaxID=31175 RepID=UPI003B3B5688